MLKSSPIFTLTAVAGRLKRALTMVLSMFCLRAFAVCQKRAILAFTKKYLKEKILKSLRFLRVYVIGFIQKGNF